MTTNSKNVTFKICLCGRYGVGKSSLRRNFMGNARFRRNYLPTIGSDFSLKDIKVDDTDVRLLIWDLAGENRFRRFRSLYFQGSHGAFVVFDLTDRDSFDAMREWVKDLFNYTETSGVPFIILGNKVDLILSEVEQAVSDKEIEEFVDEMNEEYGNRFNISFFKTSALTGNNVEEAFTALVENILEWKKNSNIILQKDSKKNQQ